MVTRVFWRGAVCLLGVMFLLSSCISVQLPGKGGRPRLIGVGRTKETPVAGGSVYEVWSPGVSLRFHRYGSGVTLGNGRLLLFLPDRAESAEGRPLGYWERVDGVEVGARRLMVGHYESLQIAEPPEGSVIQWLQFDARRPEETCLLERRMD